MSEHLFENRKSWFTHEMLHHRVKFFCNTNNHPVFRNRSEFEKHMLQNHEMTPDKISLLLDLFKRPLALTESTCNLCGKTTEQIRAHVSRHLQHLALFAIPRADYLDEAEGKNAQSNDSQHIGSGTHHTEVRNSLI